MKIDPADFASAIWWKDSLDFLQILMNLKTEGCQIGSMGESSSVQMLDWKKICPPRHTEIALGSYNLLTLVTVRHTVRVIGRLSLKIHPITGVSLSALLCKSIVFCQMFGCYCGI